MHFVFSISAPAAQTVGAFSCVLQKIFEKSCVLQEIYLLGRAHHLLSVLLIPDKIDAGSLVFLLPAKHPRQTSQKPIAQAYVCCETGRYK